jgi:hypothetical protein
MNPEAQPTPSTAAQPAPSAEAAPQAPYAVAYVGGRPSEDAIDAKLSGVTESYKPPSHVDQTTATPIKAAARWALNDVVAYLVPAFQAAWPAVFAQPAQLFPYEHGAFRGVLVDGMFAVGQFEQLGGGFSWGTGFTGVGQQGGDPRVTLASAPTAEADTAIQQLFGAIAAYRARVAIMPLYQQGRPLY